MDRRDFVAWVADTVVLPHDAVTEASSLSDIGWDSLASIALTVLAEEQWGIVVGEDDLAEVQTVGDLAGKFSNQLTG